MEASPTGEPAIAMVSEAADTETPIPEPQPVPLPVVDDVDGPGEGGATSMWWRAAEGLLAALALLLLALFFWKWRQRGTL